MHLVNGAQFLNTTILFLSFILLFASLTLFGPPAIVIVRIRSIYTSLSSHKHDLNVENLNSI